MSEYIHPKVVNAYMSYMRGHNPGMGMTLEEFVKRLKKKSNDSNGEDSK